MTTAQTATFATLLRRYRREAGLTQEALAERANVSLRAVSDLERGVYRTPHRDTVQLLAEALGLAPHDAALLEAAVVRGRGPVAVTGALNERLSSTLPVPLTSFVGRDQEVAAVADLLRRPDVRLLTLTGAPGIGKTRLSVEVAVAVRDSFADGVCMVDLAPIREPDLFASTIAQALGLREVGGQDLVESLMQYLRDKHMLLVVDNFEHVAAIAPMAADLLATLPRLKALVTSRAALHVRGEQEFPVAPLALPNLKRLPPADLLAAYPAVDLFLQRAKAVKPSFMLTPSNAAAVAAICVRLDGLPLAVELAAAWIRTLPPQALLTRLEHRLRLLIDGPRDLPPRQRALRSAIAWSDDLLDPAERVLFRQCAVFVGGWTLAAAEAMCTTAMSPASHGDDVLYGLMSLVDKNLVLQEELPTGEPRFRMLETIREYALDRLVADGMAGEMRGRHAAYFLALLAQVNPALTRPEEKWLSRVDQDYDNLRAVLVWARDTGHIAEGVCLAGALWPYWCIRSGHEGHTWLDTFARADLSSGDIDDRLLARALLGAGVLATRHDDYEQGRRRLEESLAIYRALEDTAAIADCLRKLGNVAVDSGGQLGRADDLYAESLTLYLTVR